MPNIYISTNLVFPVFTQTYITGELHKIQERDEKEYFRTTGIKSPGKYSSENCARMETVVRDGTSRASFFGFPWSTLVGVTSPNSDKEFICGGTLISKSHVVTSRDCLKKKNVSR